MYVSCIIVMENKQKTLYDNHRNKLHGKNTYFLKTLYFWKDSACYHIPKIIYLQSSG